MVKYQLGTAIVDRREAVVVLFDDAIHPLATVLAAAGGEPLGRDPTLSEMLEDWSAWRARIAAALANVTSSGAKQLAKFEPLEAAALRWLPPVRKPRKLICLGENYKDHASEMEGGTLKYPYAFLKPPSTTLRGHGDSITLLKVARQNDWEVELAVVIGTSARYVDEADALEHVAGYSIINDVSARDWIAERPELLGIDWVMQKAPDGYAPMGPFFTPAEFVPDPQRLAIGLSVNGRAMQDGNTADMVFSVRKVVSHLSRFMTLEPGDVIATGTPAGTGFGRKPQVFLQPGDIVRATIEGLGCLENTFEAQPDGDAASEPARDAHGGGATASLARTSPSRPRPRRTSS